MKKTALFAFIFLTLNLYSQNQYRSPLDIPLILSANFGELRPNHFHSGIDLKTMGVIDKPVYSIADGYVSRISISPSGYGLAIYVDHPSTGHTSVYGHLNSYAPKIAEYIKNKQYEQEKYRIDISLDNTELPLKRGELIAYSGNTGSSGGPHVHFEIRDTKTQNALDALEFYKSDIKDSQSPIIKGIAVYPMNGKGVVNNGKESFRNNISILKKGGYASLKDSIQAWGTIGLGIYANDKMTGTSNIYGVKIVRLFCDEKEIFSSNISSVDFDQTRMINSLTDFDYWYRNKAFYMKSFVEPGNKLPIYNAVNNGFVDINEERKYVFKYELEDLYGNKSSYTFNIQGKKQPIPEPEKCSQVMLWNHNNRYISDSFTLLIPKEYLYDDICFVLNQTKNDNYFSDIYEVNNRYVPLHSYCDMMLKMTKDTLVNKSQYGIVSLKGNREYWVGGTYSDGYMIGRIRELGNTYTVSTDIKAPTITPVQPARWVAQKEIKIRITDNKSGIASCKGVINGDFMLFENDVKSSVYSYKFDPKRLKKGQNQKLIFTATDACGNIATFEYEFKY
ncbi:MAG: M23 family metallopeptidase [Dysgonomonas sp.]|nr:M23 family metallopeptidase [Dysgonomonas sp.]